VMGGSTTLMLLRGNPLTANTPVVFMTARAQTRELDRFRSLGALGVIPKPFDPNAGGLGAQLHAAGARSDGRFAGCVPAEGQKGCGGAFAGSHCAEGWKPAAGHAGPNQAYRARPFESRRNLWLAEISDAAAALEDAVIAELADFGASDQTDLPLDGLLILARNCGNSAGQTARPLQLT
jgi:CheY-like chemotaxis protein